MAPRYIHPDFRGFFSNLTTKNPPFKVDPLRCIALWGFLEKHPGVFKIPEEYKRFEETLPKNFVVMLSSMSMYGTEKPDDEWRRNIMSLAEKMVLLYKKIQEKVGSKSIQTEFFKGEIIDCGDYHFAKVYPGKSIPGVVPAWWWIDFMLPGNGPNPFHSSFRAHYSICGDFYLLKLFEVKDGKIVSRGNYQKQKKYVYNTVKLLKNMSPKNGATQKKHGVAKKKGKTRRTALSPQKVLFKMVYRVVVCKGGKIRLEKQKHDTLMVVNVQRRDRSESPPAASADPIVAALMKGENYKDLESHVSKMDAAFLEDFRRWLKKALLKYHPDKPRHDPEKMGHIMTLWSLSSESQNVPKSPRPESDESDDESDYGTDDDKF